MGPMAEVARKILAVLRVDTSTHIDDLLADLEHYSSSELIAALFDLEMMGLIKQLPGRNFAKVW
jgi:DNA processing protein